MSPSHFRRQAALTLVMVTAVAFLMPPTSAQTRASLSGRVFQPDGFTPSPGVVVTLADDDGAGQWRSDPTRSDGAFRIEGARTGRYNLVVETSEGAFVSPEALELQPGINPPLSLSLKTGTSYKQDTGFGAGSGPGLSLWAKWVIAGAIGVTALFAIDEVSEDRSEADASPF